MIDAWTGQFKVHALLRATPTVCVALPRFVERTKIRERIALAETISLPVFRGHDAEVALCTYYLRSVILHIGSETTSGHYRALVGKAGQWFLGDNSKPPVSMPPFRSHNRRKLLHPIAGKAGGSGLTWHRRWSSSPCRSMSFSKKAAMDDSNAPKRGDVMQTSGDSPSASEEELLPSGGEKWRQPRQRKRRT